VVAINSFHTDTKAEIQLTRKMAEQAGARVAVSEHWLRGRRVPWSWPTRWSTPATTRSTSSSSTT